MMHLDIFDKITRHKKFEVLKINFAHKYKDHSQMLYDEFCPEQKRFSVQFLLGMEAGMGTMALKKALVDCNCQVDTHSLPLRAEAAGRMEGFVVLKFEKKLKDG